MRSNRCNRKGRIEEEKKERKLAGGDIELSSMVACASNYDYVPGIL